MKPDLLDVTAAARRFYRSPRDTWPAREFKALLPPHLPCALNWRVPERWRTPNGWKPRVGPRDWTARVWARPVEEILAQPMSEVRDRCRAAADGMADLVGADAARVLRETGQVPAAALFRLSADQRTAVAMYGAYRQLAEGGPAGWRTCARSSGSPRPCSSWSWPSPGRA